MGRVRWVVVVQPWGPGATSEIEGVHGTWHTLDAAERFASRIERNRGGVIATVVRMGSKTRAGDEG